MPRSRKRKRKLKEMSERRKFGIFWAVMLACFILVPVGLWAFVNMMVAITHNEKAVAAGINFSSGGWNGREAADANRND